MVAAVGADVQHLQVGDRVAYGQSPIGAYAEIRNVPAHQVVKIPDGVSFEQAAAIMLKGLTAQYLLRQTYRLQGGETILFHATARRGRRTMHDKRPRTGNFEKQI